MFSATIKEIIKKEDKIVVNVEFTNGTETFIRNYDFVMKADVDSNFDNLVKMELQRINDLQSCFDTLLLRKGEKQAIATDGKITITKAIIK